MQRLMGWKTRSLWLRLACILAFGLQLAAAPMQQSGLDLARIEAQDAQALNRLAGMQLNFFAQIGAPAGGWVLAAAVTPDQQAALNDQGIGFTVVDRNIPADGKGYYLLYGMPEAIVAAGGDLPLLIAVDRQALAKLSEAQAADLAGRGIAALPVNPFQLAPLAEAGAQALALAPAYSPLVQQMVNKISQSTLSSYVAQLSGETPAVIGGAPFTLSTRSSLNEQSINKATRFVYEHMQALGLPTDYDYYEFWGLQRRNVIAQQTGLTQPGRVLLLSAHLDSTSDNYMTLAPGADDNASGSAAVMAIADILSRYQFACTLRYAFYTGEEQGLYGSIDYAKKVVARGDDVESVLNLDMLGYNSRGSSPTIELHTRPGNTGDLAIANLFSNAANAYLPAGTLIPQIRQDNLRFSDHSPFWDRGIPALLAIEDWDDHTPHYHSTSDQLENLNLPYYTAFVKAALATFAQMGCLIDEGLGGRVTKSAGGAVLPDAQVSAWLSGQPSYTTLTGSDGVYYLDLPAGAYTVKFAAPGYRSETVSNVQVTSAGLTTLDRALQSCATLEGASFSSSAIFADPGQSISFQAAVSGGLAPASYSWSFGDGGSASGASTSHSFASAGVYAVTVTANNSCDYPLQITRNMLVGVGATFLPYLLK